MNIFQRLRKTLKEKKEVLSLKDCKTKDRKKKKAKKIAKSFKVSQEIAKNANFVRRSQKMQVLE